MSRIEEHLFSVLVFNRRQCYFYNDPAYCLRLYLLIPFERSRLHVQKRGYSALMERVRTAAGRRFKTLQKKLIYLGFSGKLTISTLSIAML